MSLDGKPAKPRRPWFGNPPPPDHQCGRRRLFYSAVSSRGKKNRGPPYGPVHRHYDAPSPRAHTGSRKEPGDSRPTFAVTFETARANRPPQRLTHSGVTDDDAGDASTKRRMGRGFCRCSLSASVSKRYGPASRTGSRDYPARTSLLRRPRSCQARSTENRMSSDFCTKRSSIPWLRKMPDIKKVDILRSAVVIPYPTHARQSIVRLRAGTPLVRIMVFQGCRRPFGPVRVASVRATTLRRAQFKPQSAHLANLSGPTAVRGRATPHASQQFQRNANGLVG